VSLLRNSEVLDRAVQQGRPQPRAAAKPGRAASVVAMVADVAPVRQPMIGVVVAVEAALVAAQPVATAGADGSAALRRVARRRGGRARWAGGRRRP
jgi:hypothetical protein